MKKSRWVTLFLCAVLTAATFALVGCKDCKGGGDDESSSQANSSSSYEYDPDAEPDPFD